MNAYIGVEVKPHSFLTTPLDSIISQLQVLSDLLPEKEGRYPLNSRMGGLCNRSGRFGENKLLSLPEIELWYNMETKIDMGYS